MPLQLAEGPPPLCVMQEPNGALHIRVEVHNALLGHFFGYDGIYSRVDPVEVAS